MFSVIKDEIKEEMCLVTTVNDEDVDGNPLVLKETLMSCVQNERPVNSTNLVRSINSGDTNNENTRFQDSITIDLSSHQSTNGQLYSPDCSDDVPRNFPNAEEPLTDDQSLNIVKTENDFQLDDETNPLNSVEEDPLALDCFQLCASSTRAALRLSTGLATAGEPFVCAVCGLAFAQICRLVKHVDDDHQQERGHDDCAQCGQTFLDEAALTEHERTHTEEDAFSCGLCGARCSDSAGLRRHDADRHGQLGRPGLLGCPLCGKRLANAAALVEHSHTHAQEALFGCAACEEAFAQADDLVRHVKHFPCSRCGQVLGERHLLEEHELAHARDSRHDRHLSHSCDTCDSTFATKAGLASHQRSMHKAGKVSKASNGGKAQPYTCSVCGEVFSGKKRATDHERSHPLCSVCDKRFPSEASLLDHHQIKHADRFACAICGKSFTRNDHLVRHYRTHIGDKPHRCGHCDKRFNRTEHLRRHERKKHQKRSVEVGAMATPPAPAPTPATMAYPFTLDETAPLVQGSAPVSPSESGDPGLSLPLLKVEADYLEDGASLAEVLSQKSKQESSQSPSVPSPAAETNGTKSESVPSPGQSLDEETSDTGGDRSDSGSSYAPDPDEREHLDDSDESSGSGGAEGGASRRRPARQQASQTRSHHRTAAAAANKRKKHSYYRRTYPCTICKKTFMSSSTLNAHERVHSNEKPFQCDHCGRRFAVEANLRIHKQHIHTDERAFQCTHCGKLFKAKWTLEQHEANHMDPRDYQHECAECGRRYATQSNLATHTNRCHKDRRPGEKPEQCHKCGKLLAKGSMRYHSRIDCLKPPEPDEIKLLKPHRCLDCGAGFWNHSGLVQHRTAVHLRLKDHKCDTCGRAFADRQKLVIHIRRHTGDKRYPCSECDKRFILPAERRSHETLVHGKVHDMAAIAAKRAEATRRRIEQRVEQLTIGSEGRPFRRRRPREVVKMPDGTEGPPFKCTYCDRTFRHYSRLVWHTRSHTDERPFKCGVCGRAFRSSNARREHEKLHLHLKPFKCDNCGRAFNKAPHLAAHMRLHAGDTPHKCSICGASFKRPGLLQCHLRDAHPAPEAEADANDPDADEAAAKRPRSEARPFKCDRCDKAFTNSSSLRVHSRVHTGEKPFPCDLCGAAFTQRGNMQTHQRLVHKVVKPAKPAKPKKVDKGKDMAEADPDEAKLAEPKCEATLTGGRGTEAASPGTRSRRSSRATRVVKNLCEDSEDER